MPNVRFVAQPMNAPAHGHLLRDGLAHPQFVAFSAVVAWAKASGLRRIRTALEAFRARGGVSEIVIGIDERGGTWEGLELAAELFDTAFVFHDPGSRTFHPKVYVLSGNDDALAIVGSANFTKGGLFTNYEASFVLDLHLGEVGDQAILDDVRAYFDWFTASGDACKVLNAGLIDDLRSDPSILIVSERERAARKTSSRSRTGGANASLFGSPITGLGSAPQPEGPGPSDAADDDSEPPPRPRPGVPMPTAGPVAPAPAPAGAPGFFKALSPNDVSTTSSPGQMIIPIRFIDFFPTLSVEKDDTANGGPRQLAAEFPVHFIDGGFAKDTLARVIYYEPAVHHPRQNVELRFTFRDREILERLGVGDVLVFEDEPWGIVVTRRPPGSYGGRDYDWSV